MGIYACRFAEIVMGELLLNNSVGNKILRLCYSMAIIMIIAFALLNQNSVDTKNLITIDLLYSSYGST